MSLKVIDKDIYLNNTVISEKSFLGEDIVEVVSIEKEHLNDFYNLKNCDICDNIEVYCDTDSYSLNLFKEGDKTFISKAIEILDKDEVISIEDFNELISKEFSKVSGIEVIADEDSIEDSLNILLSSKLDGNESVKEVSTKIDDAYQELVKKIF